MEEMVIDLQDKFIYNAGYLAPLLRSGCLAKLNELIRTKNKIDRDIFWAKEEGDLVRVGYEKNPDAKISGIHNNVLLEYDIVNNAALFQFVVFDGCNAWNCYKDVPCYGAPEENTDAGFHFIQDDTKWHYKVFTKKS